MSREPGLESRVARQRRRISSQHRQLDSLYEIVADALRRRLRAGTRSAFSRFRDALEAHLALEESLYFPAIHGLHPELERELEAMVQEHVGLRRGLEEIDAALSDVCDLHEVGVLLEETVAALARHEEQEENLIRRTRLAGP